MALTDPHSGMIEAIVEDGNGKAILFDNISQARFAMERWGFTKDQIKGYDLFPVINLNPGVKRSYRAHLKRKEAHR